MLLFAFYGNETDLHCILATFSHVKSCEECFAQIVWLYYEMFHLSERHAVNINKAQIDIEKK